MRQGQWTTQAVADAWRRGEGYQQAGSAMRTDGLAVSSYGHQIGYTAAPDGAKVAVTCPYSMTTRRHCSALAVVADRVEPCAEHGDWVRRPERRAGR